MKLKASVDRLKDKEATDLLDVVRLVTDPATAEVAMTELQEADSQLLADVALHADRQFRQRLARTVRIVRQLGRSDVDSDLIEGAADYLLALVPPR
jgi:hypothetical protein